MRVADEADEIANGGIKNTEPWRRISLRTRRVGEIADGFQADHGGDFVAVGLASARVNETAHLRCLEVRRLFVKKSDKTQQSRWRSFWVTTRPREQWHDTHPIIGCGVGNADSINIC